MVSYVPILHQRLFVFSVRVWVGHTLTEKLEVCYYLGSGRGRPGQWAPGQHDYQVSARSATNLPPGKFALTVSSDRVRLEWRPIVKDHGGGVVREAVVK